MESKIECCAERLVEVTRGELIESTHRGMIAVVDGHGRLVAGVGDVGVKTWYRSAAKPFQTIPIVSSGAADHFRFSARELAVVAGSHSGEAIHLECVLEILSKIGLTPEALQCGAHLPFDEKSAKQMRAEGRTPTSLHNNCSGKHAGMLALARFLGAPIENYLAPDHPVQIKNRVALARFAGVEPDQVAVAIDGCSAPVFGLSVEAMACSYARLTARLEGETDAGLRSAAERVVAAMLDYPEMIGGTRGRLDTDLMRAGRGRIISKVGAEGVQLLGVKPEPNYPAGLGVAIKIEDGDIRRARDPVVIETLRQLGVLDQDQLAQLARYAQATIFNHRKLEVGVVRPCFILPIRSTSI